MDRQVLRSSASIAGPIPATLLIALALVMAACFPDYDRFRDVPAADAGDNNGNNSTNNGEPDTDVTNNGEPDADTDVTNNGEPDADTDVTNNGEPDADADLPDADADLDVPVDTDVTDDVDADSADVMDERQPDGEIGTACNAATDCGAGLICQTDFDGGLCTRPCATDAECPSNAVCGAMVGMPVCLRTCETSCASIRPWECVAWRGGPRVCVSDDDFDGALNSVDNCAESNPNPDQHDADEDGLGDACDPDRFCPIEGGDFVDVGYGVDRAAPPRSLRDGALVFIRARDQYIYLGGHNAAGEPVADVTLYDRKTDTWSSGAIPALPYPAARLAATWDPYRNELIATPGEEPGTFSRLLLLPLSGGFHPQVGQWRSGPSLPVPLYHAGITYAFPDHVVIVGYAEADQASLNNRVLAYLYDRRTQRVTLIDPGLSANATPDPAADMIVSRAPDGKVYAVDAARQNVVYVIDPRAGTMVESFLATPLYFSALPGPPPPILASITYLPFYYAVRLDTGEIRRIKFNPGAPTASMSQLTLPVPANQAIENLAFDGALNPFTASFFVISTTRDAGVTSIREYFPMCQIDAIGTPLDDYDNDRISALVDNCPDGNVNGSGRNTDQLDVDRDGVGDKCDPDLDGDGVPNEADTVTVGGEIVDLSNDSDNDGVANDADIDDDGDRIIDGEDPSLGDTDNDGIPNYVDDDDDDDGYSDDAERAAGSSATDWVSIPGGERLAFVYVESGTRQMAVTTLSDLADVAAFDNAPIATVEVGDALPVGPRLWDDQPWLLYSDQADPVSPRLVVQPLELVADVLPAPISVQIDGLLAGEAGFLRTTPTPQVAVLRRVVNPDDQITVWSVDRVVDDVDMNTLGAIENLYTTTFPLHGLSTNELDTIAFAQGIAGCSICDDIYLMDALGGTPARLEGADIGYGESAPRLRSGSDDALFLVGPDGQRQLWRLVGAGFVAELLTPEDLDVRAAAFAQTSDRVLIVARAINGAGPYRLWLLDTRSDRLWPLSPEGIDVIDLDFAR